MREDIQKQVGALENMVAEDNFILNASYVIARKIAINKKPHTIGEELMKPKMLQVCEVVFGKQPVQKLKVIPMSVDTAKRRIEKMAKDIQNHDIKMEEKIHYFIQFNLMNQRA